MPFKSKAQQAYLTAHKPELAKAFAAKTGPKGKRLPAKVRKTK